MIIAAPPRRTVAKGAAWTAPVVAMGVVATRVAASCGSKPWDANLQYVLTCNGSGANCQVAIRICATNFCGSNAVPTGVQMTLSITNNGTASDTITKDSGAGYTISSSTAGAPGNGSSAALAAGATWTYTVQTSSPIPAGSCIQFAFSSVDATTITLAGTIVGGDGNNSNSTNCSKTVSTDTTASPLPLC